MSSLDEFRVDNAALLDGLLRIKQELTFDRLPITEIERIASVLIEGDHPGTELLAKLARVQAVAWEAKRQPMICPCMGLHWELHLIASCRATLGMRRD